jgi:sialate O-acetylesterase
MLGSLSAEATVMPSRLFSDHAVLQQGMRVPVWGAAADGEKVTVTFAGQTASATPQNGRWMVWLSPMHASATPRTMTITGSNTVTIHDILVGEVWICSGQSNMERQLGPRPPQKLLVNWANEAASANYPEIRQMLLPHIASAQPTSALSGTWTVCSPQAVVNFTAVGYYFGRDLHNALQVPIGLIHTSWGGTPAEAWTRREALAANPALSPMLDDYEKSLADYPGLLAQFQADHAAHPQSSPDPYTAPELRPPRPPNDPAKSPFSPSHLYNSMINPLLPCAIRGVIWYQGEANTLRGLQYRTLFPAMIADWRKQWNEGDFPFLFVQLAPYVKNSPELREAQFLTALNTPNTAMVVTTDCGDPDNVHPANKEPVGARLALAARALAYGEKIEYSGPLYKDSKIGGGNVTVTFTHIGKGLTSNAESLRGFTIAGPDRNFVPAVATIHGQTVVVSSPEVAAPVAVRYDWSYTPAGNLSNLDGLPASPFRTDPNGE